MKYIPLTQGKSTVVDDEDYDRLSKHKWYCAYYGGKRRLPYAVRTIYTNGKRTIKMHREIMDAPESLVVDHINRDTLDNCKHNLRVCTSSENLYNSTYKKPTERNPYKGVHLRRNGKFQATIYYDGRLRTIGTFETALEAAKNRDEWTRKVQGVYGLVNIKDAV